MEHQFETLKSCPLCGSKKLEKELTTYDYFFTKEEFVICKCRSCDFHFTNPRPVSSELSRYYQSENYISHSNSKKGIVGLLYQQVRKFTLRNKYLLINHYRKGENILDIGCATGQFLHEFKRRGWNCVGIEPDEKARQFAEDVHHVKVFDETGLVELESESFDVITMWHVLEHVSDLEQRMKDLQRLIKKNGLLFVALPNYKSWDARYYKSYWAGLDVPRHLYHFSKDNVQMLFDQYGFEIQKIYPMVFDSFYVSLLSEKYKKNPLYLFSAFLKGFYSNLMGRKNYPNHSSLLYVIKPKIV